MAPWAWISKFKALRLALLALVYVGGAAIILGANPLRGEVVGPFDLLAAQPGWQPSDEEVIVRNRERSDILDSLIPEWSEARRQIRSGHAPLWNPVAAGGQGALFVPSRSIMTVAFLAFLVTPSAALGFYFGVLSSLVLAGLGMHLFVARRCHEVAGLFAGISYMMCGFITAWLFWPHTLTAIWIPWLLLAVDWHVDRPSFKSVAAIALVTALMFLGGFPFVVAIGMGAALVHAGVASYSAGLRSFLGAIAWVGAGMALGVCLVAVQLLSLWAMLEGTDLSYRNGGTPLDLGDAKLLLRPWASASPQVESNMFPGMVAMALGAVGLFYLVALRRRRLLVSGVVFVGVGAALVFGLLPLEIGRSLPVLSNNPWSRAILLLDIGIILLAAVGLDGVIKRLGAGRVAITCALLLCMFQAVDLLYQFRRFNGSTPAGYYYAADNNLQSLAKTIGRFEYVAQDGHFLISGTTGALGLADWFAHSMRSPEMRSLLLSLAEKPFSSPTSTSAEIGSFYWQSPVMDAVGTCYAIYTHHRGPIAVVRAEGQDRYAMPAFDGDPVVQQVNLVSDSLVSSVQVRLATYGETLKGGQLVLSLVDAADRAVPIATSTLLASEVVDNQFAEFKFDDSVPVQAGEYYLQLSYKPGPRNERLTAWVLRSGAGLSRGGEPLPGTLEYVITGPLDGGLELLSVEGNTLVARNPGCMKGPYFTESLAEPMATANGEAAELVNYVPHDFTVRVDAPGAGFLVVPMQWQRGWTVDVNGERQNPQRLFDVLPAIAVSEGRSTIRFRYAPPYWVYGATISGVSIGLFAILWLVWRRRKGLSDARRRGGADDS